MPRFAGDPALPSAERSLSQQRGIPGSEILRFAGTLTPQDASEMQHAIEEACERVDPDGW